MGKPTGFLEYERKTSIEKEVSDRIKDFDEFHIPIPKEEQQIQGSRCMECGVPFCQSGIVLNGMTTGCPLNNLIPEWNDLIYTGNWKEALNRLLKTNNFPEFTGRVCPAPCEAACISGLNDKSIAIKENELSIIENAYEGGYFEIEIPKVRTGKKVAVIGSGPSGLAAADQLNKRGHSVTVYERDDRLGGLLMYGIPNMKLEKNIVDRRVNVMKQMGIEFITNADIGVNYSASEILKQYDSIVLACGASNPRDIDVTGRNSKGIYFAVDFLKSTTKSLLNSNLEDCNFISAKDKKVLVIGGGDTGNDCVATSIRHGCKSVVQLEIMPKLPDSRTENNPWPEWAKVCKTDYGQQEYIDIFGHDPRVYQTTVKEFIADKSENVCKVKLVKLESVKDNAGKFKMQEIQESEYVLEADLVLIAAGFLGCQNYITDSFGVNLDERTNVKTEASKYQTNVAKIFTAGDMHRGQSLVVWAIREGREAAKAVDEFLMNA